MDAGSSQKSPHSQTHTHPKTSGMAIASLVCGLLGCLILPALLGIIFGIIAIQQINESGGALKGKGLAVCGLVASVLMTIIVWGTTLGASLTGYIMIKKVDEVMEGISSASVLTADDPSVAVDDHNKTDDDNGTATNAAQRGDGGKSNGSSTNPLDPDDPDELVAIVDGSDPAAANRSIVVNPKGTQGKRYIVVEIYMQRSEPKDTKFKERAGKNTKRLQEIATRELEGHTIDDLQKPITKEYIRRMLQKKFNGLLEGDGFRYPVGKIVYSKWIIQ